ncbi:MAG TPA: hypothetical protein VKA43_12060 [Gammaproteobacteria bacterium]|nr:hypothetical protein [Gammaproteobacteria bacterium]
MKTIHTILRQDFGVLDPNLIRTQILAAAGVHAVELEPAHNGLAIEYDAEILTPPKLFDLLCLCGVYPAPQGPSSDAPTRDDG